MNVLTRIREKPLKPGDELFHYQIETFIGMGGYGILYLATSTKTGKKVVIKQLRARKLNEVGMKSFQGEKEILEKLSHPSIPSYEEHFILQNKPYLVMSKMKGISLEELIFEKKKVFSKEEGFQLVAELLEIVSYLHLHQIVHRDLRPPNIIVDNKQISVIDFGLADFIKSETKEPSSLMREYHPRSDFYAIGHTLLFVLYTSYTPTTHRSRSWEEELVDLTNAEKCFIRRLLQIEDPFGDATEALAIVRSILNNKAL